MSYKKAECLLAAVIIARATSLLIIRLCLSGFSTFNLIALRFTIAFFCLIPFARGRPRKIHRATLFRGAALGGLFFVVIAVELQGLRMTNSSAVTSFLENTAIVLVPILEALFHRRWPETRNLSGAILAVAGVGLLLLRGGGFTFSAGELVCLSTALLYALYMILTDRLSRQDDPLLLGFLAIGVVGATGSVASLLFEEFRLPVNGREWLGILLLAVVCSSVGTALQPVAQRYVPSERACVFCALNPLATSVMGSLFLKENLGISGFAGAVLILVSMVVSASLKEGPAPAGKRWMSLYGIVRKA